MKNLQKLKALLAEHSKEQRHNSSKSVSRRGGKAKTPLVSADIHRQKLNGARFRYLNEMLYTTASSDAFTAFQKDQGLFEQYHDGFRRQVEMWPSNPLDVICNNLQRLTKKSKRYTVADMGCGEAELSLRLQSERVIVHSFDLVAGNERITAANIKNVPLPNESVDCVVFCLSLMGTDYGDFLREAFRILKDGGVLIIAEVKSRIRDLSEFIRGVSSIGFQAGNSNTDNKMFVTTEFRKVKMAAKSKTKASKLPSLGACIYKRR